MMVEDNNVMQSELVVEVNRWQPQFKDALLYNRHLCSFMSRKTAMNVTVSHSNSTHMWYRDTTTTEHNWPVPLPSLYDRRDDFIRLYSMPRFFCPRGISRTLFRNFIYHWKHNGFTYCTIAYAFLFHGTLAEEETVQWAIDAVRNNKHLLFCLRWLCCFDSIWKSQRIPEIAYKRLVKDRFYKMLFMYAQSVGVDTTKMADFMSEDGHFCECMWDRRTNSGIIGCALSDKAASVSSSGVESAESRVVEDSEVHTVCVSSSASSDSAVDCASEGSSPKSAERESSGVGLQSSSGDSSDGLLAKSSSGVSTESASDETGEPSSSPSSSSPSNPENKRKRGGSKKMNSRILNSTATLLNLLRSSNIDYGQNNSNSSEQQQTQTPPTASEDASYDEPQEIEEHRPVCNCKGEYSFYPDMEALIKESLNGESIEALQFDINKDVPYKWLLWDSTPLTCPCHEEDYEHNCFRRSNIGDDHVPQEEKELDRLKFSSCLDMCKAVVKKCQEDHFKFVSAILDNFYSSETELDFNPMRTLQYCDPECSTDSDMQTCSSHIVEEMPQFISWMYLLYKSLKEHYSSFEKFVVKFFLPLWTTLSALSDTAKLNTDTSVSFDEVTDFSEHIREKVYPSEKESTTNSHLVEIQPRSKMDSEPQVIINVSVTAPFEWHHRRMMCSKSVLSNVELDVNELEREKIEVCTPLDWYSCKDVLNYNVIDCDTVRATDSDILHSNLFTSLVPETVADIPHLISIYILKDEYHLISHSSFQTLAENIENFTYLEELNKDFGSNRVMTLEELGLEEEEDKEEEEEEGQYESHYNESYEDETFTEDHQQVSCVSDEDYTPAEPASGRIVPCRESQLLENNTVERSNESRTIDCSEPVVEEQSSGLTDDSVLADVTIKSPATEEKLSEAKQECDMCNKETDNQKSKNNTSKRRNKKNKNRNGKRNNNRNGREDAKFLFCNGKSMCKTGKEAHPEEDDSDDVLMEFIDVDDQTIREDGTVNLKYIQCGQLYTEHYKLSETVLEAIKPNNEPISSSNTAENETPGVENTNICSSDTKDTGSLQVSGDSQYSLMSDCKDFTSDQNNDSRREDEEVTQLTSNMVDAPVVTKEDSSSSFILQPNISDVPSASTSSGLHADEQEASSSLPSVAANFLETLPTNEQRSSTPHTETEVNPLCNISSVCVTNQLVESKNNGSSSSSSESSFSDHSSSASSSEHSSESSSSEEQSSESSSFESSTESSSSALSSGSSSDQSSESSSSPDDDTHTLTVSPSDVSGALEADYLPQDCLNYSAPYQIKMEFKPLPEPKVNYLTRVPYLPEELQKFYLRRHMFFSKFDAGIRLDHESWYSVTPECVAAHQARRCLWAATGKKSLPKHRFSGPLFENKTIAIDGFCGSGGNAIQLAMLFDLVVAIDLDPVKIENAKHNAAIYGVKDKIRFICGDFFEVVPNIKASVVFLSPPWGGVNYEKMEEFDVLSMGGSDFPTLRMMEVAKKAADNVALYIPRTSDMTQVIALGLPFGSVDIEVNRVHGRASTVTAYYGSTCANYRRKC